MLNNSYECIKLYLISPFFFWIRNKCYFLSTCLQESFKIIWLTSKGDFLKFVSFRLAALVGNDVRTLSVKVFSLLCHLIMKRLTNYMMQIECFIRFLSFICLNIIHVNIGTIVLFTTPLVSFCRFIWSTSSQHDHWFLEINLFSLIIILV